MKQWVPGVMFVVLLALILFFVVFRVPVHQINPPKVHPLLMYSCTPNGCVNEPNGRYSQEECVRTCGKYYCEWNASDGYSGYCTQTYDHGDTRTVYDMCPNINTTTNISGVCNQKHKNQTWKCDPDDGIIACLDGEPGCVSSKPNCILYECCGSSGYSTCVWSSTPQPSPCKASTSPNCQSQQCTVPNAILGTYYGCNNGKCEMVKAASAPNAYGLTPDDGCVKCNGNVCYGVATGNQIVSSDTLPNYESFCVSILADTCPPSYSHDKTTGCNGNLGLTSGWCWKKGDPSNPNCNARCSDPDTCVGRCVFEQNLPDGCVGGGATPLLNPNQCGEASCGTYGYVAQPDPSRAAEWGQCLQSYYGCTCVPQESIWPNAPSSAPGKKNIGKGRYVSVCDTCGGNSMDSCGYLVAKRCNVSSSDVEASVCRPIDAGAADYDCFCTGPRGSDNVESACDPEQFPYIAWCTEGSKGTACKTKGCVGCEVEVSTLPNSVCPPDFLPNLRSETYCEQLFNTGAGTVDQLMVCPDGSSCTIGSKDDYYKIFESHISDAAKCAVKDVYFVCENDGETPCETMANFNKKHGIPTGDNPSDCRFYNQGTAHLWTDAGVQATSGINVKTTTATC